MALPYRVSDVVERPAREPPADVLRLMAREEARIPHDSPSAMPASPRSPSPSVKRGAGRLEESAGIAFAARDDPMEALYFALPRVLEMLQAAACRRRELSRESVDTWTQIDITPDIRLSVRGMTDEDAPLLRWVGRLLRQLAAGSSREIDE